MYLSPIRSLLAGSLKSCMGVDVCFHSFKASVESTLTLLRFLIVDEET
jgi:hypothetical protein